MGAAWSGKTTIARLLADHIDLEFEPLRRCFLVLPITQGVRKGEELRLGGRGTLLFVDEIHRFNRAQQDKLLPYVKDGTVVLVGATTENPSFELNAAHCRVARSSFWNGWMLPHSRR